MFYLKHALMQAEPGAGGAAAAEPELFTGDYVRGLREESQRWRGQAEAALQALEQAEAAARVAGEQSAVLQQAAASRVLQAELRAAARQAGMVDLDGLKLADASVLQLREDGSVEGIDAVLEVLRQGKPWLFAGASHSAAPQPAPRPRETEPLDARRLSATEYKAARARLVVEGR